MAINDEFWLLDIIRYFLFKRTEGGFQPEDGQNRVICCYNKGESKLQENFHLILKITIWKMSILAVVIKFWNIENLGIAFLL